MGATSFDARIRVGNKRALEKLMGIVEIKVMNDAVAECRTEYLALLGIVNDESTWKARLCIALSANRHTTAPYSPSGSSAISARMTSSSYAVQRRRTQCIGRRAVAGVLACILPYSEYFF